MSHKLSPGATTCVMATETLSGGAAAVAQRAGDDASREQAEATDNDGGQFAVATLLIEVSCRLRVRRFEMVPMALIGGSGDSRGVRCAGRARNMATH